MKKTIFTAFALGAMVLAGCTKVETVDVPESRAIAFDNFVINSVKSLDNESLTKFYVYGSYGDGTGTAIFINEEVTKNEGQWIYSPARYWDTDNTRYKFAAYSDNNSNLGTIDTENEDVTYNHTTGHLTIKDFPKTDRNLTKDDDLIYAFANNGGNGFDGATHPENVQFEFKHILSHVTFNFIKAADLNGVNLKISNISVNVDKQGTFIGNAMKDINHGTEPATTQFPLSCWTDNTNYENVIIETTGTTISADYGEEGNTYSVVSTFIPQKLVQAENPTQITFTLEYSNEIANNGTINNDGDKVTKTFKCNIFGTSDYNWNPGYKYVYTAEINASNLDGLNPIDFTVNVSGWENENVSDIVPDNEQGSSN